jgi:hypothetical protein
LAALLAVFYGKERNRGGLMEKFFCKFILIIMILFRMTMLKKRGLLNEIFPDEAPNCEPGPLRWQQDTRMGAQ